MANVTDIQTTASDGDILMAAGWNDIKENILRVDDMTKDTTEYTTNSTTDDNVKSYTFTPTSSNNVILAYKFKADIKIQGGGATCSARLRVIVATDGDDDPELGTHYLTTTSTSDDNQTIWSGFDSAPAGTAAAGSVLAGQSTYTLAIYTRTSDAGQTAYINDIEITIFWMDLESGTITTSSGKFS